MDAPIVLVVCYDVKRMTARYGQKGRELLTKLDCMLCVQNILLAATHFGAGYLLRCRVRSSSADEGIGHPQRNHTHLVDPNGLSGRAATTSLSPASG